jgi:hypothetical protein
VKTRFRPKNPEIDFGFFQCAEHDQRLGGESALPNG